MQGIQAIVGGERILHSIQREPRPGNAVCIPANDGAKVGFVVEVSRKLVKAQNNIVHAAALIRHPQGDDDAAIVCGAYFETVRIGQSVEFHGTTLYGAESFLLHGVGPICTRGKRYAAHERNQDNECRTS